MRSLISKGKGQTDPRPIPGTTLKAKKLIVTLEENRFLINQNGRAISVILKVILKLFGKLSESAFGLNSSHISFIFTYISSHISPCAERIEKSKACIVNRFSNGMAVSGIKFFIYPIKQEDTS